MLNKDSLINLIRTHNLLQCEVDSRHIALINDVLQLGMNLGINQAKESIVWRINGPMWAGFIDEEANKLSAVLDETKTADCV